MISVHVSQEIENDSVVIFSLIQPTLVETIYNDSGSINIHESTVEVQYHYGLHHYCTLSLPTPIADDCVYYIFFIFCLTGNMHDYSIKLSINTYGKGNICKTVAEYSSNFEQIP